MIAVEPRRYVCARCGEARGDPGSCTRDGSPLVDGGDDALLGTEIGGYRVAAVIGRGGMGTVYRAVQPASDAEVAIKVLARELVDDRESSERFVNEARVANRVRHEGLVKVLYVGLLPDGRPYLIMEHLTGCPLSSLVGDALPLGTLLRRLAEAARAIGAMHAAGVIHRDLKPANLFVTTAGYIVVLDFGIAKLADERTHLTRTGHAIGTPAYMSPEQAQAEPLDARSDIYSFGVVLYEAIVGRRPFEGRVLDAMAARELPPHLPAPVPRELDAIVRRAMAPAPDDRFAAIGELAEALDRVAAALPLDAHAELVHDAALAPTLPPTAPAQPPDPPAETVVANKGARRLGRYVVQDTAGRGGEGVVWIGVDPRVQRKVALKLVDIDTPDRRARLIAEAQAMARVSHPNVVTLYELSEDGEQLFLAMEYVDAADLERWLAERPRDWREIVAMFVDAGRGLAAAHAVGVVHRDFKPANVLVGKEGRPRVADFGIAEIGANRGDGVGTAAFMAPEQVEGAVVDPRADQFAFCAALWWALHGEAPYAGANAVALAMAARRAELRTAANPRVPDAITAALRRGLAADPAARFPEMTALLAALVAACDERRRRRWWPLAIAGAATAAGAVAWAATRGARDAPQPGAAPTMSPAQLRAIADPMDRLRAIAALPPDVRALREVRAIAADAAVDGIVHAVDLDVDARGEPAFSRSGETLVVPTERELVVIPLSSRQARKVSGPPRIPRRVYLDDAAGRIRALFDDEIAAGALDGSSWTTIARCDPGRPAHANSDLTILACRGSPQITVDGAPRLAIGPRDAVAFAPTRPRVVIRREDAIEVYDLARPGDAPLARRVVTTTAAATGDDGLVAYVGDDGVVLWDPVADATVSLQMRAERLEVIGGPDPVVLVGAGASALAVRYAREPLRIESLDAPRPVALTSAGTRVVERSADQIVVRDYTHGVAWRRRGAPGVVAADPRGTVIASVDRRAVKLWTVGAPPATTIRDGVFARIADDAVITTRRGRRAPLRAFDLNGRLLHEVAEPARLTPSHDALLVERDGAALRWRPNARTLEALSANAADGVELRGELVAALDGGLVRLRDRTRVCSGELVAVSPDRSTVLVAEAGTPPRISACRLLDGSSTELRAGSTGTAWVLSRDGRHAALVDRGRVAVLDTHSGAPLPLPGALASVHVEAIALGPPGRIVVAAKQGLLAVDGASVVTLTQAAPNKNPTFADDGKRVATLSGSRVVVWNLEDRTSYDVGMLAEDGDVTSGLEIAHGHVVAHNLGRTRVAIWPLEPPSAEAIERLLAP